MTPPHSHTDAAAMLANRQRKRLRVRRGSVALPTTVAIVMSAVHTTMATMNV